ARACRELGDEDGAALELESARAAFERLEARPDLAHAEAVSVQPRVPRSAGYLTPRELEVLRLVATGRTNRQIAAELALSEKTVDRHVSNIFAKIDVPTRAAATAYAFRHRLLYAPHVRRAVRRPSRTISSSSGPTGNGTLCSPATFTGHRPAWVGLPSVAAVRLGGSSEALLPSAALSCP